MIGMPPDSGLSRRYLLQILAGGAAYAAGIRPSAASQTRLATLIDQAKVLPNIAQRIDFISGALRGTRYRGYTLIGGPRRPERFVVRDDGFDCVTFCETVLAAARASNFDEFETTLRSIRYHNGVVAWRERNHYFFEWGQHNIDNKTCRAVEIDGAVALDKTVSAQRGLGHRHFAMTVIPHAALLANKARLATGDIIGFVTVRPNLDYFHVGFVAIGKDGELLLRHASQSRRHVLDERLDGFLSAYRVRYVTLLRPEEPAAAAVAAKKAG